VNHKATGRALSPGENYSLLIMAVKSMEMAVEVMESMEMAPGALPHPDRMLE
jgi:hypothetical protein